LAKPLFNKATLDGCQERGGLSGSGLEPTYTADQIGFSRGISPVMKDFILRHYNAYGGTKPPPIDHQGIDDAFIEKASVVWYFHDGKWLKLTGAD